MSIYGFYFVKTMLDQMGWPRRKGLLNSTAVVDTMVADQIINQMIDWAAALGACRPKLALQAIAWIYKDKNWEGDDAPKIVEFIKNAKNIWESKGNNKPPHEIIGGLNLSEHFGKTISSKHLKDVQMRIELEKVFLGAVLWGLANPDYFKTWYESDYNNKTEELPMMQKAGLEVSSIPSLPEFLKESEEMLKGYESEVDPLPEIPPKLLEAARQLGRDISD